MNYPRPVEDIHQIELTSRCNLRCRYCPHPHMKRSKQDMDWGTFLRSMEFVRHYVKQGTQNELALTGIGEPTMYPHLLEAMSVARDVLGPNRLLTMSTNGVTFTEKIAEACEEFDVTVFVSMHRPEVAGPAMQLAKQHGILGDVNLSAVTNAMNWAGQVKWHVSAPNLPCAYLLHGWGVILADGDITTCCLDSEKKGYIGNVFKNEPAELRLAPYSLCDTCHNKVP
jgi:hypothetical protein